MNVCKFIEKFNKLKKSSSDSIDNIFSFDDFRKYMHVIRATEIDLKSILSAVNSSNKKTLILLEFTVKSLYNINIHESEFVTKNLYKFLEYDIK